MFEARQYYWSIVGDYVYRNHTVPRTKLYVPKDDFQIPPNHIDVQRPTNTSIDALHEATVDDYWNISGDFSLSEPWIRVTRFELLNKKTTRRDYEGSRQTD